MSRTLVLTGATGLVGTAVTAALLPAFDRALVLTTGDRDPETASIRAKVAAVLEATGDDPGHARHLQSLALRDADGAALARLGFGTVAQVWNIGATLSYDMDRLRHTVDANAAAPVRLLRLCRPQERFFQVSTVGVTGPGDPGRTPSLVLEEPVWDVDAVNPYVVSKVLAEHMLDGLREREGHPVTSLRVGSVIGPAGHRPVQANRAGYYTLVEMIAKVRSRGATLTLDIAETLAPPLVHVDQLAASCASLAERAAAEAEVSAYYHLGDQRLRNGEAIDAVNAALGGDVLAIGAPRTALDRGFASVNADNVAFMSCPFVFDHRNVDSQVPAAARPRVDATSFAGFVTAQLEFGGRRGRARTAAAA
ncbi:NAD-dependent epimerase/dehydratase family protein [Streptomyces sp. NPDC058221]|uniref:NAD-dependent epimerase/dehydratase family protein n=1 Tax=Streptomyces sp. NPDC058221 TaxID=3346388 RepID=UPI0036E40268